MSVADIDWNTLFKFVSFFFLHFYRIDLQRRDFGKRAKEKTISIDMSRSSAIKIELCSQAGSECVIEKCFRTNVATDSALELRTFHPDILCRKRQYEFQDGICCNAFVIRLVTLFRWPWTDHVIRGHKRRNGSWTCTTWSFSFCSVVSHTSAFFVCWRKRVDHHNRSPRKWLKCTQALSSHKCKHLKLADCLSLNNLSSMPIYCSYYALRVQILLAALKIGFQRNRYLYGNSIGNAMIITTNVRQSRGVTCMQIFEFGQLTPTRHRESSRWA